MPTPPQIKAWYFDVSRGSAKDCMRGVLDDAAAEGAEVLVVDGEMIFGADHIASAAFHAQKAIREGRNSSDSLTMETLLYASGERQLGRAIDKMSVNEDTTRIVVALLSEGGFDQKDQWHRLPARDSSADIERYVGYGLTMEELDTVRPERRADLVLERVAAVDLLKR